MEPLRIADVFAALPPVPAQPLRPRIRELADRETRTLVVLDDDPTGTQTVHDVPVLTRWDVATLERELRAASPCFYVLTNSRSLAPDESAVLHREFAVNVRHAVSASGRGCTIVSRSDSTLRGHFPLETDVLAAELGPFDATFLIPYFEAGGRVTLNDVHFVAEGGQLIPAAQTPFAQDAVFGYRESNLRRWIAEKTGGRVAPDEVASVELHELREMSPARLAGRLAALRDSAFVIVNACHPRDVEAFALASLEAERLGRRFLYRSAAGFVAARLGLEPAAPWQPSPETPDTATGGLVVVGSHVLKTTEQLAHLLAHRDIAAIELDVPALLSPRRQLLIDSSLQELCALLREGRDVVLHTSRQAVSGRSAAETLAIAKRVSNALVELVRRIECAPRFLIAKGGITSSDIATRGLGVQRAMVLGQILPGVPVWQLGTGARFPGMPYIVFPGNVGTASSLHDALGAFDAPARCTERMHPG